MRIFTNISPTLKMRGLRHREIIVTNKSYKAVKIRARIGIQEIWIQSLYFELLCYPAFIRGLQL